MLYLAFTLHYLCVVLSLVTCPAYERLILDAIRGDRSLFVRTDELEWAWRLFTPVLNQLESQHVVPVRSWSPKLFLFLTPFFCLSVCLSLSHSLTHTHTHGSSLFFSLSVSLFLSLFLSFSLIFFLFF